MPAESVRLKRNGEETTCFLTTQKGCPKAAFLSFYLILKLYF